MSENVLSELLANVSKSMSDIIGDNLKEVFLFGSYARGDYDEESDVDVALIIDESRSEIKKYQAAIASTVSDISINDDILVSICCIPFEEFEHYKNALPFYRNIMNEGVRVVA